MIKEVAGKLVGNEKPEKKGKVQKVVGEPQAAIGDLKQEVKDVGSIASVKRPVTFVAVGQNRA